MSLNQSSLYLGLTVLHFNYIKCIFIALTIYNTNFFKTMLLTRVQLYSLLSLEKSSCCHFGYVSTNAPPCLRLCTSFHSQYSELRSTKKLSEVIEASDTDASSSPPVTPAAHASRSGAPWQQGLHVWTSAQCCAHLLMEGECK